MTEVVASVRRVTDIIGEITAASQEQTAGIDQIYQAIMQMDDVTQQNAALIEQAAAAAASLKDQAGSLVEVVRVFKTDGSGMTGEPVSKPAAQPAAPGVRRAAPKTHCPHPGRFAKGTGHCNGSSAQRRLGSFLSVSVGRLVSRPVCQALHWSGGPHARP